MGQIYDVRVQIVISNVSDFISKSKSYLENENINESYLANADLSTVDGIMEFVLAADQDMYERRGNEFVSSFHASYGWESILEGWFRAIQDSLKAGYIKVWPDNGRWMIFA